MPKARDNHRLSGRRVDSRAACQSNGGESVRRPNLRPESARCSPPFLTSGCHQENDKSQMHRGLVDSVIQWRSKTAGGGSTRRSYITDDRPILISDLVAGLLLITGADTGEGQNFRTGDL